MARGQALVRRQPTEQPEEPFNLPPRIRQSAFVLLFGLTLLSIAWLHLVVTLIKRKEASGAYDAVAA